VPNGPQDVQSVSGHYIVSRRADTTLMSILTVLGETKIYGNDDGTLSVSDLKDANGEPKKFKEIAPLLFRDVNGQDRVAFKRDASGNLVEVIDFPFMVFQKSSWNRNSAFQQPLIITSLVVLALTLILWPVMALVRRHYGRTLDLGPQQWRIRLLVRLACLLIIVFFATYAIFFSMAEKDIGLLSPHGNVWIRLIQIAGWLGILGTIAAVIYALRSWQQPQRWMLARVCDTVIALAFIGVVWFVFTWNLLAWSLKY
jgi:hypothetical protein